MPDEKEKERKFAKDFLEKWIRAGREEGPADEALVRVDEALRAAPDDPTLWFRRASILADLERWDEALDAFRRVEAIDPAFPRLFVGLSFVLARLGRAEEAAEAQRRSLGALGLGPEPERDAELALEALAEDLRKEEAGKALEELGTIVGAEPTPEAPGTPFGPEATPEEDFEGRLARWAAAGYDVSPLREIMEREPDRTRTAFFQFEQNLRSVEVLRETVDTLRPEGLEADIARVRDLFLAPYQIWRIEAEMATLLEKADARDRALRAARVGPRVEQPTRVQVGRAPPSPPAERIIGPAGPRGRVNGQTGRVNGQGGRVNGLINGVARARAGLTNGLTNGLGFTNGLGASRFAQESRARRGRILFIPAVAVLLLASVLIAPPEVRPPLGGISVDGSSLDWQGISGYTQGPSTFNADVDLRGYKAFFQDGHLSLYATVSGTAFGDARDLDVAHAFVDTDGDRSTGYDEGVVGADYLIELQGGNGSVTSAASWTWVGNDSADWSGWSSGGPGVLTASSGPGLEFQADFGDTAFDPSRAAVVLTFEDQVGGRSTSELAFGPNYGALKVTQNRARTTVQAGGLQNVLNLTLEAIGAAVTVNTISTNPAALAGFSPLTIDADEMVTVTLVLDTTGLAAETLLTAELLAVDADRPATILGSPARVYVDRRPAGLVVDGVFDDWRGVALANDSDSVAVTNPNVDVLQFAAESQNGTAFAYAAMGGDALGGGHALWPRSRPQQGPPSQPSPPGGPPEPRRGEDVIRVYYDTNATEGGTPIGPIVADAFVEVRGRHGRVLRTAAWAWDSLDGWGRRGTPRAAVDGDEWETSLDLPGVDLRGADFVITTTDWKNTRDATQAGGVRGTRAGPGGVIYSGSYDVLLPQSGDGWIRFGVDEGPSLAWRLPEWRTADDQGENVIGTPRPVTLAADGYAFTYADAFEGVAADVLYELEILGLKETILLRTPPATRTGDVLLVEFPMDRGDELMAYVTGEETDLGLRVRGDMKYVDGRGVTFRLGAPWAQDLRGRHVDLVYLLRSNRLAIEIPGTWLAEAVYPVHIDPTVTYQLENDNAASNDPGENFGYSVAVGDFDGDGDADALVGAPANNRGGSLHGYAYVFYGPFSADDSSPDLEINGTTTTARFGYSVAAGKFNNDNYWDLLIARLAITSAPGDVAIYFGSASGPDATADVTFTYPSSPAFFGWWVAAGNLDNANYDDVLIGEPGRDNVPGGTDQDGIVHVYKSPFGATESTADYTLIPSTNVSGRFGRAIAVGKIDSDAYADVVVGEPLEANGGRVHFFQGSHFATGSGTVSPDATLSARASGQQFGAALSVGTLNGDGYADVVVGAPQNNSGAGAAYVYLASSGGTGLTTGANPDVTISNQTAGEGFGTSVLVVDFDDDGTNGVMVGAPNSDTGGTDGGSAYWFDAPLSDQTRDETINGGQSTSEFLGYSLAAGRFGSDVRTIVLIGAYLWDDGSSGDNSGRVIVAAVPEPALVLVAATVAIGLGPRLLQRRRLVRKG